VKHGGALSLIVRRAPRGAVMISPRTMLRDIPDEKWQVPMEFMRKAHGDPGRRSTNL
jgi:hypothetical protein